MVQSEIPGTPTVAELGEAERGRIHADELYRIGVRDAYKAPDRRSRLARMLTSDNLKWLVVTLLIPLTAFFWNMAQADREEARRDVDQLTALVPVLASDSERQRNVGRVVLKRMVDSGGAAPALKAAYEEINREISQKLSSPVKEVREQGAIEAEVIARADLKATESAGIPAPAQTVSPAATAPAQLPNRVYIQYYSEAQAPAVRELRDALRLTGVPVPGAENVLVTHPDTALKYPQRGTIGVRFFQDEDLPAATWLADFIRNRAQGSSVELQRVKTSNKVPAGQLEVWLPLPPAAAGTAGGG